MIEALAVAVGGALGALARFWLGRAADDLFGINFPWSILIINVLGSITIGIAFELLVERNSAAAIWRPLLMVGFLGAFTTFSSFSLQTLALIESARLLAAGGYVMASVGICVIGTWAGIQTARLLW